MDSFSFRLETMMLPYAKAPKNEKVANADLWFAHSASHGWVMLDRRQPQNVCSTMTEGFIFIRCRDGVEYQQGDLPWNYRSVDRYLGSLPFKEAMEAEQELAGVMEAYGG